MIEWYVAFSYEIGNKEGKGFWSGVVKASTRSEALKASHKIVLEKAGQRAEDIIYTFMYCEPNHLQGT